MPCFSSASRSLQSNGGGERDHTVCVRATETNGRRDYTAAVVSQAFHVYIAMLHGVYVLHRVARLKALFQ